MGKYVRENLNQLVRRVVKQKKLKLRDIQEKSGGQIDKSYVSRIITGNIKNISLDKLAALARGLDEELSTLFAAYFGHPPPSAKEPEEVFELNVQEFISLMQKVSLNPDLIEIMKEAVYLRPEECTAVLRYVSYLNERKRKSKRSKKLSSDKAVS